MIPDDFHFLRPEWLAALIPLVPLLWWAWRSQGLAAGWERVCEPHLLRHLLTTPGRRSLRWPLLLFAIGWVGTCLALAGPSWERLPQTAFKQPSRTVFVLGLAPSMNQRDVAPSRLARARHKLQDAIDRMDGGSAALIVYREEAYPAVPLTEDTQVLKEMIPLLDTALTPGRRVRPARGLEAARTLLEPVGLSGARILLVSDGADDDPATTRSVAKELAERGAHLSVLSIAGENASLASLASAGNGAYAVLTADGSDLETLLGDDTIEFGTALARSEIQTDEWRDMGAWLVWIPLLLAPLAFRKGWAAIVLLIAVLQFPASSAEAGIRDWFERPDQRASRAFVAEDYESAARDFEDPSWQAAARYRAGDFESAAQALEGRSDPTSEYNRGNALALSGRLEEAVAAYDRALALSPGDEDARFNRELVAKLLEEQQKKNQQNQDSSDSKESSEGDSSGKQDAKGDPGQQDPSQDADDGSNSKNSDSKNGSDSESSASDQDRSTGADPASASNEEAGKDADQAGNEADSSAEPSKGSSQVDGSKSEGEKSEQDGRDDRSGTSSASAPPEPGTAQGIPPGDTEERRQDLADGTRPEGTETTGAGTPSTSPPMSAREQDMARWMGRLPDDPAGLLREKIRRDYLRKQEMRAKGVRP